MRYKNVLRKPLRKIKNNGEQVTGTGQTASQLSVLFHKPKGTRKSQPYKEEKLANVGVVQITWNNRPAGETLFT